MATKNKISIFAQYYVFIIIGVLLLISFLVYLNSDFNFTIEIPWLVCLLIGVIIGIAIIGYQKKWWSNLPTLKNSSSTNTGSLKTWAFIIGAIVLLYIFVPRWNEFWRDRRTGHTMEEIRIHQQYGTSPTNTSPAPIARCIEYGTHTFNPGVVKHYNRGFVAQYFYPAEPNVTFTLRFQDDNDPSSHWDYKVTTGSNGAIISDQRLDDQDKRHSGSHSVTILYGDVAHDVVFSDHAQQ
jgi:hypothetical protein